MSRLSEDARLRLWSMAAAAAIFVISTLAMHACMSHRETFRLETSSCAADPLYPRILALYRASGGRL